MEMYAQRAAMVFLVLSGVHLTLTSPPNIVLILSDDLGWDDVGFHGSEIKTPYIDKLAYDGVILKNYYVSPICTPTRGSLMTGRHPIHLGLQHYVIAAPEPWGLPLNHTTMAQHFKRLGYATHIVGKWHLGFFRKEYLPTNRGFDSHYGYWTGRDDYFTHIDIDWHLGFFKKEYLPTSRGFDSHFGYWTGKEDYYDHMNNNHGYKGYDFRKNMEVINTTGYTTEMYTHAAVDIINTHDKSKPMFMYLPYQNVHAGNANAPLQAPAKYVNRLPYIKNKKRRIFRGMVSAMDDSVGAVMQALQENGMMNNTIVVFSTDNGGPANNYDGNAACNYPLRGTKNTLWEGGVHGVGFIHSDLIEKRHTVSDNLMHVSDWLPTLYSAAGGNIADLGNIDGIDMWNMLKTNGTNIRTEVLHNIDPIAKFSAIRVGDYKLIQGDISHHRNDEWYRCDPPLLNDLVSETNDTQFSANSRYEQYKDTDVETVLIEEYIEFEFREKKRNLLKRDSANTPIYIDCGPRPFNLSAICMPEVKPCLFHIPTDPCEYTNIAWFNPSVVSVLQDRIKAYEQTAVTPVNRPPDKKANPALYGGVWVNWEDMSHY